MATRAGPDSLTITGKLRSILLTAVLLTSCNEPLPADTAQQRVDPADYSAFYLWSGVAPHQAVERAEAVYLLWGELRAADPATIVPLRRTVPQPGKAELWLVVRAERLDWSESAYVQLIEAARRWNRDGNLTGIQVDFDSGTGGLGNYAAFLRDLRQRLPESLKLSATGLMDWPANAADADLAALSDVLDEIVVQTYRHTSTVPDYRRYLAATERLDLPYRIALVEGGEWSAPDHLAEDPEFIGYIVFLLGERQRQKP